MKLKNLIAFIASSLITIFIYTQFFQFKFEVNRDINQFFFYTQTAESGWKKHESTWGGTIPIKVKKGESFVVSLEGNRTNIAKWFDVTAANNFIVLVDEKSVTMKKGLFEKDKEGEAPYQMQFVYKAVEVGQAKLKFQLKPPAVSGEVGDENLCINVDVSVE